VSLGDEVLVSRNDLVRRRMRWKAQVNDFLENKDAADNGRWCWRWTGKLMGVAATYPSVIESPKVTIAQVAGEAITARWST
jgi:hypothetical protein